jgi:glycosyltransferase involved in cell wall biosynthesis
MMSTRLSDLKAKLENSIISNFNSLRFELTEPVMLRWARMQHDKEYSLDRSNPLITVYIPTYNRGKILLERALPSVLSQTYKNFELVIIGDHCTDDTEKLVSSINDPRVRFYNLPSRGWRYPETAENHWFAGPVVPANKALEMATGKWVARVDDDDTWTVDHLEKLLRFAQENNYEFVSGQFTGFKNGRETVYKGVRPASYYSQKKMLKNDASPLIGGTATWLYRSYLTFIKYNINCWRKSWNRVNDADFANRVYRANVRTGFLPEVLAYVLPRPGEDQTGLEAYLSKAEEKKEHYKFKG